MAPTSPSPSRPTARSSCVATRPPSVFPSPSAARSRPGSARRLASRLKRAGSKRRARGAGSWARSSTSRPSTRSARLGGPASPSSVPRVVERSVSPSPLARSSVGRAELGHVSAAAQASEEGRPTVRGLAGPSSEAEEVRPSFTLITASTQADLCLPASLQRQVLLADFAPLSSSCT